MNRTDLNLLTGIVEQQGRRLLSLQPRRALPDLNSMRSTFEQVSGEAIGQMRQTLAANWPGIPLSQTAVEPARQPSAHGASHWICDPVDGAVQYLAGLPLWTITVCLVTGGQPVLAVIHEPASGRTWRAQAGGGAECDGEPLRCAGRSDLALATIGTSFPNYPQRPQVEIDSFLAHLGRTIPQVFAQRWMGPASLSLAQVGAGILDGYWEIGRSLYDWLPGILVAQEAGARITALDGGPLDWNSDGILAASAAMHPSLNKLLMQASGDSRDTVLALG